MSAGGEREAFELAVGALARKEHTEAELRGHLASRGVAARDAEAAIARLAAIGELDDERFALSYAADKRELSGWGPERIELALRERGVAPALAARAAATEGHAELLARATALVRERHGAPAHDGERARALAFLARRGFGSEVAYEAVRAAGRPG